MEIGDQTGTAGKPHPRTSETGGLKNFNPNYQYGFVSVSADKGINGDGVGVSVGIQGTLCTLLLQSVSIESSRP